MDITTCLLLVGFAGSVFFGIRGVVWHEEVTPLSLGWHCVAIMLWLHVLLIQASK